LGGRWPGDNEKNKYCELASTKELKNTTNVSLAPVVRRLDSAIHWINLDTAGKFKQNETRWVLAICQNEPVGMTVQ